MKIRTPHKPHHPFPTGLRNDCVKAAEILESFLGDKAHTSPAASWSRDTLLNVKGLVIVTFLRAAFMGSARFGSGIFVSRLDGGEWSPPSAVIIAGVGFGGQMGIDLTDFIFFLHDKTAVNVFNHALGLTLGCSAGLALGPFGRCLEVAGAINTSGTSAFSAHAKTMGVMGSVSVQLDLVMENRLANRALYGKDVTVRDLRGQQIAPPQEAEPLMRILQSDRFTPHGEPLGDLLNYRSLIARSNQMLVEQESGNQGHSDA